MPVTLVGLNHTTAPVTLRERLYIAPAHLERAYRDFMRIPLLREMCLLSTCNRTEVYAVGSDAASLTAHLCALGGLAGDEVATHLYVKEDLAAVRHLFRVAAGLDSQVIGDTQILGQVRQAKACADACGTNGRELNRLLQLALTLGKRVRTETTLSDGASSVGGAAVAFAQSLFPNLDAHPVLILGAGKIAELTARHLTARGVRSVFVANRSYAHAEALAAQLGGRAIHFHELPTYLRQIDIVISSTSAPHLVLDAAEVAQAMTYRAQRPLCLLDIALPRDIDPAAGDIEQVHLYTIDDLRNVTDESSNQRCAAVPHAEAIIEDGLRQWREQQIGLAAAPQITTISGTFEQIRQQALQCAESELSRLSPEQRQSIERLTYRMMQQMAHVSITRLKEAYANEVEEQTKYSTMEGHVK